MKSLLTEIEAANYLCLSSATLRKWRCVGKGPSFLKIGSAVRYDLQIIRSYLEECRQRPSGKEI